MPLIIFYGQGGRDPTYMKLLKKIFAFIFILLFIAGCSDEPGQLTSGSGIEEVDGETFSVFNLDSNTDAEITGTHEVMFHISNLKLEKDFSFPGTITGERNFSGGMAGIRIRCRLLLKDFDVPNGEYFISISGEGIPALGAFKIRVLNKTITAVGRSAYQYTDLNGEGTLESPYQVGSANEFEKFISMLHSDPDHGYGIYFAQTADISFETLIDGVAGVAPFQGTYDGQGHKLEGLQWRERSSKYEDSGDRGIGLFTTICNATVRNLNITRVEFSHISQMGGFLAGIAKGKNTLENISAEGVLSVRGDYAGGLIGYVQGTLTASGITIGNSTSISGINYTGGLFGYLENGNVSLNNVEMGESTAMEVIGREYVGGIAGFMVKSTLSGTQIFDFATNSAGVMEIPAPDGFASSYGGMVYGGNKVGGLVGYAHDSKLLQLASSAFIDADGEDVGGVVGYFEDASNVGLIEDCIFNGKITPHFNKNTGGIVGQFRSANGGRIQDCVNYSSFVGGDRTGGICGYLYKEHNTASGTKNLVQVSWAVNAGKVEGRGNVGGIIGEAHLLDDNKQYSYIMTYEIDINSCMNAGDVIAFGGDSGKDLGGIAGRSGALTQFYACANHGTIEVQGKLHAAGGIVGCAGRNYGHEERDFYNTKVIECINTGTMNATDKSAWIGGIAGYAEEGTGNTNGIWSCRNSGTITANQNDDTGGILGYIDWDSVLSGCFNNGRVEHGNAILGTHKVFGLGTWLDPKCYYLEGSGKSWPSDHTFSIPQSQIADASKYVGYDFTTIWEITPDGPNLRRNKWRDPASAIIPK